MKADAAPPPAVVSRWTSGGIDGYSGGQKTSKAKRPSAYGVSTGPLSSARHTSTTRVQYLWVQFMCEAKEGMQEEEEIEER